LVKLFLPVQTWVNQAKSESRSR